MGNCARPLSLIALVAGMSLSGFNVATASSVTIDFDNLPTLGGTSGSQSLADANGGSSTIDGVTFGNNFSVVGDDYRINGAAPNPAYGVPHSGHYFVTNGNTPNDGLIITTSLVLTEAWFGRNEYYGYGGAAVSVTVTAVGASGDLDFVKLTLPDTFPYTGNVPDTNDTIGNGLPDPMVRMDTSQFLALSGITSYRIDRDDGGRTQNGNWVADDFTFQTASPVPEPTSLAALSIGFITMVAFHLRNLKKAEHIRC